MGEVTEKTYCCDRGDNDNALATAIVRIRYRAKERIRYICIKMVF